ncbi:Uma2 family endonuclease [Dolichospermum sp. ST_con]|nr:Uma2 family endonuclease [Dolichospermum sp. ST_con]MDD1421843.1 Uma2 family endonuclease [Dolichospermum sp. ST_sed1]MDD1427270.1 Uma2 family endonuclease [Dolichospermum sp. ST_sed9]MDD1432748.1 Uma2 family endonuclease [Dolichospermum sp. ST_sed6]MDD1438006.1 Uma2 family endonuclease [Dolichospermum sp. ST_sed10]MDD1443042.1 Uma2 family endonuclease [Dolichospermum sp. ST_sed3]MDD1448214.1 Uma2 family endonuclease [Dolichospermum sp. ST_sed8]MDD1457442.1 Uma2 family endonuclease [Dolic
MQIQTSSKYYTPEEYLELEEKSEVKNEYIHGEIIPMSGGTTNHNRIALNFCTNFKFNMRTQNYNIYMSDVKLWMSRYQIYTYPDIMVIQGEPIYEGNGTTQVTNPLLIVEVLSKSTINYDKTDKFRFYRSLPELKEYIMINQYEYFIEQFAKNTEGQWVLTEYESINDILSLKSIDFQIPFSDIYEGVHFQ